MNIIEIVALDNGAHRNQSGGFSVVPEGWAVVPDDLVTQNFPFGEVTVEEIDGVPTVIKWDALPMPDPEPETDPEPTQLDLIEAQVTYTAMMTDTLLEV